jgi:hypothetical protein
MSIIIFLFQIMSANPTARIEQLDNIEKDVIAILENASLTMQEVAKDRPIQKSTDQVRQHI